MWIAITYRKRGEYSRSIELLENIIAINPEMWYYYHELAVSYYRSDFPIREQGIFPVA